VEDEGTSRSEEAHEEKEAEGGRGGVPGKIGMGRRLRQKEEEGGKERKEEEEVEEEGIYPEMQSSCRRRCR